MALPVHPRPGSPTGRADEDFARQVRQQLFRLVLDNGNTSTIAAFVLAVAVVVLLREVLSRPVFVWWLVVTTLLFVGRLIVSKGIQCVIAALPSILEQVPNARLLVVGHGPMREPIEAMLWALELGKRELLGKIIAWGRYLEGAREPEPLGHVRAYLDMLERDGKLERYFQVARETRVSERVIFTGYLTHRELRYLFPCCDVALFPSIVAEAGPLVFLEAMASGVFPLGIYFAGMAASIDSTRTAVPGEVADLMKLRQAEEHTVADIVSGTLGALKLGRAHAADLRRVAVERFDWRAVGKKLIDTLDPR